jgi:fructokinase
MMKRRERMQLAKPPEIIGTGLIALDIVVGYGSEAPALAAGGTCGNVLAIMGFMGWRSFPVARLRNDYAAKTIMKDLGRCNVGLDYARCRPGGSTPIVLERVSRDGAGQGQHRFGFRCPQCGARYPGYQAVCASAVRGLIEQIKNPAVFFMDRLSRGALLLAEACAKQGALVVFEPSANCEPRLFREAASVAHVMKYSSARANDLGDLPVKNSLLVEIETSGHEGLRFRSWLPASASKEWRYLGAYDVASVKDTAGCGDWCTAGILRKIGSEGFAGLRKTTDKGLIEALKYGQAAAAWNCGFEGARGGMNHVDLARFDAEMVRIMAGNVVTTNTKQPIDFKQATSSAPRGHTIYRYITPSSPR